MWCDAVCRAHDNPGEFLDDMWINRYETPRYYPNAVTLSKDRGSDSQLEHIRELVELATSGNWGFKDSFCALDLRPLGLRKLFEATWIYRAASLPAPDERVAGVRWAKVTGAFELAAWETAWVGEPAPEMHSERGRTFLPSLLTDKDITFIAAYQNHRIVAGAVANRAAEVVGVSNVFVPSIDGTGFRAGCVAEVIGAFPGLPVVGYEKGHDLAVAQTLGFEVLGPLSVWEMMNDSK